MSYTFSAFSVPLFFASAVSGLLAFHVWRHHLEYRCGVPFSLLMVAVGGWAFAYAMEILGATAATKSFWETLIIIFVALVAPLWLTVAFEYTGREHWLSRRNILLLFSPAFLTISFVLTNHHHHLVWTEILMVDSGPFLATLPVRGPWFWIHAALSYAYIVIGLGFYALSFVHAPQPFRIQSYLMIVGGLLPLAGNFLHIVGLISVPGLDLGPFAFTVSGLVMTMALFHYRLLDLSPVAQRAILESMREGVVVVDTRGRVVEINPPARKMLRLPEEGVLGRAANTVLGSLANWESMGEADSPIEVRVEGEAGERWIAVSSSQLTDRRGRTVGRLVVLRDTTEAQLLERMREDLWRMLVHDLSNPLGVVKVGLDTLLECQDLSSDGLQVVKLAQKGISRALLLVNTILDLNKLERGQIPLDRQAVSLGCIVMEVVQSMKPLADKRSIQLEIALPDDLSTAWADKPLVTRILQNLLDNAIKFSSAQGVIRVMGWELAEDLALSVWNSGPGIPPELQRQVFHKFATGRHKQRGSGLGLAFCKLAVEAHGGQISVESVPGEGTTFFFTLPRYTGQRAVTDDLDD